MYIELNNIYKKFNDNYILKNVSLKIKKGDIVGIIGRNGSGKTVLLKILTGLYHSTSGEVKIDNFVIGRDIEFPQKTGILIDTDFLPNETGLKNLMMIAETIKNFEKSKCYDVMKIVGLDPFSKTKYKNYSSGMKQKLKIAQALLEECELLVLDEPFNAIDKESVSLFRKIFLKLNKEHGTTIILTSHYEEDIKLLCDRVYEMDKGVIYEKNQI